MNICIDIRQTQNIHRERGIGRYGYNLISRLPVMDPRSKYYYVYHETSDLPALSADVVEKVTFIPFPKNKPKIWDGLRWQKIVDKHKIDFVFIPDIQTPFPLPKRTKIICVVHDLIPLIIPEFFYGGMNFFTRLKFKIRYSAFHRNLKKVDKIIADSEHTKNDIIQHLKIEAGKISVVYAGVDFDKFQKATLNSEVLKKYNIKKPYVLYFGGFDKRKNVPRLLEAYKAAGIYDHSFVIAGKPSKIDYEIILSKIEELEIKKHIHFTGYVDDSDLPIIFKEAKCYLYPSLYEGFGLPVLEAMAAGVPVITSNVSSIPEIAHEVAVLINPHNAQEIANALTRLTNKNNSFDLLIERGKARAKCFAWGKTVQGIIQQW